MSSTTRHNSTLQTVTLVARGVVIETLRRKDLVVLMLFSAIYVMGMIVALLVGVENAATIAFLLNLGISLAWFSAHLFTVLVAARQVPDEVENRTLYPLLAKPVWRGEYLLGKWVASAGCGLLTFFLLLTFSMLPWVFAPFSPTLDLTLFVQATVLTVISLAMIAALTLLLSLVAPKPVTITVMVLTAVFAPKAMQFTMARLHGTALQTPGEWILAYIPNFTKLNLFDRFTDGMHAVGGGTFLGLCLYATIFTVAALIAADRIFSRQAL